MSTMQTPRQYDYDYNDRGSKTAVVSAPAENPMTAPQTVVRPGLNPQRGDIFGLKGVVDRTPQHLAGPMERKMGVKVTKVTNVPCLDEVHPDGQPNRMFNWYQPSQYQPLFGLDMKSPATLIGIAAAAFLAFKLLKK